MKKIVVIIIIFIGSLNISVGQDQIKSDHIKLVYGGPAFDQNIGDMFFLSEKTDPSIYISGIVFELCKKDFINIKNILIKNKLLIQVDTTAVGYYRFSIISDNKTSTFKAINPERVRIIFNEIAGQIRKASLRKKVQGTFDILYEKMLTPH